MSSAQSADARVELDLSDFDRRARKPMVGGRLHEPFAKDSRFGGLVAPQTTCMRLDSGHSAPLVSVQTVLTSQDGAIVPIADDELELSL